MLRAVSIELGSFPQESFALLPELEGSSFWFRARNNLIAWALHAYFPDAMSLLEIGCGTGFVLASLRERFPALELTGGDPSPAGLEVARQRLPGVPLSDLDACRLPFESDFDVVAAFDVLEHIDEDEVALAGLARAARPGGGVIVTVPQHPRLWSAVDEFSGHRRRYRRSELVAKLVAAGLEPLRITSFVSLLLPAVGLSRLLHRRVKASSYDPRTEYSLPRAVNALFGSVMALERALVSRGVSFPFGTSLLAVTRRP
jgi:SAM-dependent methyltransferase